MATSFLASAEFQQKTTLRLDAFLLYASLLSRDSSTAERQSVIAEIGGPAGVDAVVGRFLSSPEFNRLLQ